MPRIESFHRQAARQQIAKLRLLEQELPLRTRRFFASIADQTSPLTRLAYCYDLRLFFDFLKAEVPRFAGCDVPSLSDDDLQAITIEDLQIYPEYLSLYFRTAEATTPKENQEAGKMRKICSLRSFYAYLFENKVVPGNLASLLPLPKLRKKEILRLEPDEIARLLDAAERSDGFHGHQKAYSTHTAVRDVAILTLLLGTGIRVTELVGLNRSDVDMEENAFLVTRKGGKQMILYFSQEVAGALARYQDVRQGIETMEGHEDALFLSLQRKRIGQRAVENLVKKYAAIASPLKKRISPHKLRSTFGTQLYNETGDIYLVADVLGHEDVNTTRKHYAAMNESRRRLAAEVIKLRED